MILTLLTVCRNEANSEYFKEYLDYNVKLFDHHIAYDDCSTDDTSRILESYGFKILNSDFSQFRNELLIRQNLVRIAKKSFPNTNWFVILDIDEVLLSSRQELEELLRRADELSCQGVAFNLINLWKSKVDFRIDEYFDLVEKVHAWKNLEVLTFSSGTGLHLDLHPVNIKKIMKQKRIRILHLGFYSRNLIVKKFLTYKNLGQRGRMLWRLIDERQLETNRLTQVLPCLGENGKDWLSKWTNSPPEKETLSKYLMEVRKLESYRTEFHATLPLVTLVCLIYAGIDWLEFAYGELLRLQSELENGRIEILFCANDPTDEIVDFLIQNNIPHVIFRNENPTEHYLSRVYRAYNFAVSASKGEYCLLVNSDMAYSPGFMTRMLNERDENTLLVAKLVESGTLKSGPHATKRNFGKHLYTFKREKFYKFASKIQSEKKADGGLYMPLLVHKQKFLNLGGFPEGNIAPKSLSRYLNGESAQISLPGDPCISGDEALFRKAKKLGMKHFTCFNSVSYHFQEGEKRNLSKLKNMRVSSGVAFANELFPWSNSQKNMFALLAKLLEKSGIKVFHLGTPQEEFTRIISWKKFFKHQNRKINPRIKIESLTTNPNFIEVQISLPSQHSPNKIVSREENRLKTMTNNTIIVNNVNSIDLDAISHYIWLLYQTDDEELQQFQLHSDEFINEFTEILKQELIRSFLPILTAKFHSRVRNRLARAKFVYLND